MFTKKFNGAKLYIKERIEELFSKKQIINRSDNLFAYKNFESAIKILQLSF